MSSRCLSKQPWQGRGTVPDSIEAGSWQLEPQCRAAGQQEANPQSQLDSSTEFADSHTRSVDPKHTSTGSEWQALN